MARLIARAHTEVGALVVVTALIAVALIAATVFGMPSFPSDGVVSLLVAVTAVAIGATGAVLAEIAARLSGTASLSWVSFAVWVLSVVVVPSTIQGVGIASVTERSVLQLTALLLGVVALAVGTRSPARRPGVRVVTCTLALLVLADVAARAHPDGVAVAVGRGCSVVVLGVSAVAASSYVVLGIRRRSTGFVRLGAGIAMIVLAEAFRDTTASVVLLLVGLGVVAAGAFDLARIAYGERMGRQRVLEDELEKVEADRDELLAGSAKRDHELRNGLSGLSAMAEVIEQAPSRNEQGRLRQVVEEELTRMVRIVDGAEYPDGSYELGVLVDGVATIGRAAGMTITADLPDGVLVVGRRAAMHQVLTNLVLNCARHAPGSPVEIRVSCDDHRARIAVRDHGPGIPPQDRERVFDSGVHRPDGGGSGLGLFISRELVTGDGGTVAVEPDPHGTGCTVVVVLPARRGVALRRSSAA